MIPVMIKSAVVLAVAGFIASALRRQSAALRHAIWTAGLIGALVVPLLSITLPSWQSGIAGRIVGRTETLFQPGVAKTSAVSSDIRVVSNAPPATPPPSTQDSGHPTEAAPSLHWFRDWSYWEIGIAVWLAGSVLGILFMLIGAARLAWVAIRSEAVTDARLTDLAEDVRRSIGLRRPVRLLQSRGHFLGTWGILVPRVLVPADAVTWSDDRVWMVMGHELAHIQRHDWVVQVLAEAARAIYWFNPIFWISYSRLRRESEHACDDAVLRMGAAGTQYAEELLELARALHNEGHMRSPILAMAQPSHLELRLVALLNPALNRLAATPWSIVVVALVAIGLTLPLAAVRPREISAAPASALPVVVSAGTTAVKVAATSAATPTSAPTPEPGPAKPDTPKVIVTELAKVAVPASIGSPDISPQLPLRAAPAALIVKLGVPTVAAPPPFECKVTPSVQMKMVSTKTSPLGPGPWHVSTDGLIQTWDQPFVAGARVNTMWTRPANADFTIIGRRLDGDAPPLQAQFAKDSSAGYIATSLNFPVAGCWEVTATAGSSTLTFVTKVESQ